MSRQGDGFDGWRPRFPEGLLNIDTVPSLSLPASLQDQHLGGCQREKRAWEGGRESLKGAWLCAFHLLHGAVTDITSSL